MKPHYNFKASCTLLADVGGEMAGSGQAGASVKYRKYIP